MSVGRNGSAEICGLQTRFICFGSGHCRFTGEFGEGVAFIVEVDVREAEFCEAGGEPAGARGFPERRRGDREELAVPALKLLLVQVHPREGAVNGAVAGECGDAAVGERGGHRRASLGFAAGPALRPCPAGLCASSAGHPL